jgi:hypothetical protein
MINIYHYKRSLIFIIFLNLFYIRKFQIIFSKNFQEMNYCILYILLSFLNFNILCVFGWHSERYYVTCYELGKIECLVETEGFSIVSKQWARCVSKEKFLDLANRGKFYINLNVPDNSEFVYLTCMHEFYGRDLIVDLYDTCKCW